MPDIEVKVNWKQFDRAMKAVPGLLYSNLRKRMFDHHSRFLNRFKRKMAKGGPNQVKNRSRALSRSFKTDVRGLDLERLEVETFSSGVPYARIQEEGGTVTPTHGQWLTIPLDAAKTGSGVARGRAEDFDNTFFRRSAAGNLILFQTTADGIVPLFVLKKSVQIPGNLNFIRTFRDLERDFGREINAGVDDALKPQAVEK